MKGSNCGTLKRRMHSVKRVVHVSYSRLGMNMYGTKPAYAQVSALSLFICTFVNRSVYVKNVNRVAVKYSSVVRESRCSRVNLVIRTYSEYRHLAPRCHLNRRLF